MCPHPNLRIFEKTHNDLLFCVFALRSESAAAVLKSGLGVCSGYAYLFEALAKEMGLVCASPGGHCRGGGYKLGDTFTGKPATHGKVQATDSIMINDVINNNN